MPLHDWTRVKAGTYHNFHIGWIVAIMDRLNAGVLPSGHFAMAELRVGLPETEAHSLLPEQERYARKANRIAIHRELDEVVAVIDIVSPGNKDRKSVLQSFVDKAVHLIAQGVNLLIIDPFPPTRHDPQGIHKAIWDEFTDEPFELPPDKPLILAAYHAEPDKTAYVEPIAVGDRLRDMPLFLYDDVYVPVPLEQTYQATWDALPAELRRLLD